MEEDESLADTLVAGFPEHNHTIPSRLIGKEEFIDALGDNDEGSEDSDMEDLEKEIDIQISSGNGSSDDEDKLEDEDLSKFSKPAPWQLHTMKPTKTHSHRSTVTKTRSKREGTPNIYDPSTCREWLI